MMNEVIMIPPEEMKMLMEKHSQRITSNPHLTKAARLSAVQDKLLHSKLSPGLKQSQLKSLATRIRGATNKYKKGPSSGIVNAPEEEQNKVFIKLLRSVLRSKPRATDIISPSWPVSRKKRKKRSGELSQLLPSRNWIPYKTRSRDRHV